jgi:hypothetical protein
MSRLPFPGQDDNTWGDILNEYLNISHNADGTLKASAITAAGGAVDASVVHTTGNENIGGTKTFVISPIIPTPTTDTAAANKSYVDSVASAGASDATASSKGIVQLAGDLGGTASSPTVPSLASKEPTITAGTTSQYYRGDKSWQTLDKTAVGLSNVDNTSDATKNSTSVALTNKDLTSGTNTFPTFNQDTTGTAAKTNALNSSTTAVDVAAAAAPSNGQVLTATSSAAATWQTPVTGLTDPGNNGILSRTATNTTIARTITGTTNQITVTNGDGVAGNPTLSLPSTITANLTGSASLNVLKAGDTMSGTLNSFTVMPVTTATYMLGDSSHYYTELYAT